MSYQTVIGEPGRIVCVNLLPDSQLTDTILDVCRKENIHTAVILSFIGTISEVWLRNPRDTTVLPVQDESEFADQVDTTVLQRQMEIISVTGNVTTFEDELFLNLHAVFSEAGGNLRGGHIFRATIWSQGELFIQELKKVQITRERDYEVTGLPQICLHQLT